MNLVPAVQEHPTVDLILRGLGPDVAYHSSTKGGRVVYHLFNVRVPKAPDLLRQAAYNSALDRVKKLLSGRACRVYASSPAGVDAGVLGFEVSEAA